jgi:predicted ATPase/class 3 adenylate cyclase/DNA-binding winged helix-turn-helix (wHTH) protein
LEEQVTEPPVSLSVLGPVEVERGGTPLRLGSPQQRRVLAMLAVHANEVVSSDRLVDVLWGEAAPASASHTLQTLVSRLRAVLGSERIETVAPGYRLRVEAGEVDSVRFEKLVRAALGEEHPGLATPKFEEALALWRGCPYAEFADEEFASAEVARLAELRMCAVEEHAAALVELGRPAEVIGAVETEIALEPFRERLRGVLMLALARAGRPVEALRAFDAYRRLLADEVGVVPSPALQALNDDIVRQHPDVGWEASSTKGSDTAELPSGTVTFVFTDVEGSTRLWEEHPEGMRSALARHDAILRAALNAHGGHVVKTTGDGIHAVFGTARDALDAAVAMQRGLVVQQFGETGALRVRMGVHTCEAEYRDGDYFGSGVNRAARLMSVAHGGQVVVSAATSELLRGTDVELIDLGEHRLRDLTTVERVFQVAAPGLEREFPPLRSVDAWPGNLPRQMTTFVGRDAEIASLTELIGLSSLVTLTGVGGVGKTRLALRVAAEVSGDFRDGAWLCEFAPIADPAAVWEAVAACLRVEPLPGRALDESVLDYLAAKRLLLVLDNCEHVLDAVARVVDAIEQRCPHMSMLVTSREGLALAGERIVAVSPLVVPASDASRDELGQAEAVRLFCDRASAAKSDFVLTNRNHAAVGVLCRRLDGIPLAIELAAARVRSLSPEDLASRLDQRFELLTRGSRAAPDRHQTLRSTIDWSYDLLTPTERRGLERLSVFAGGCDLAAAEAVLPDDDLDAADVVEVLAQLVDKSLVVADDAAGVLRYRLLETIRQYAREQLEASGDLSALRRRHADHYIAQAETAGPHLRSREHLEWTNLVMRDLDNLRSVLDWAVETPSPDHALRLIAPLATQGRIGELAMDWAATAVTIPGGDGHPLVPAVAAWAAWGATIGREFERAEHLIAVAERVEAALGTRLASVGRGRTMVAFFVNDFEEARRHATEWGELARASEDDYDLAEALNMLGAALRFTEATVDAAIATVEEAVRIARAAGNDAALVAGLSSLATWLPVEESHTAVALLDEAIEVGIRAGERLIVSYARGIVARLAVQGGDWPTGLQRSVEAAEQKLEIGAHLLMSDSLWMGGVALCALGACEPAAVLLANANAFTEPWVPDWIRELNAATQAALLEALGEQQVATLAARGAALDVSEAVAYLRAEAERALAGIA